jgi:hypothetical protein
MLRIAAWRAEGFLLLSAPPLRVLPKCIDGGTDGQSLRCLGSLLGFANFQLVGDGLTHCHDTYLLGCFDAHTFARLTPLSAVLGCEYVSRRLCLVAGAGARRGRPGYPSAL